MISIQWYKHIYKFKYKTHMQKQVAPLFRYEPFINFWLLFFNMRRETILKSLLYHTMLTTSFNSRNPSLCPNGRNSTIIFHGPTSKAQLPGRTSNSQHHGQNSTLWQRTLFSAPMAETQLSSCLAHSQLPTSTVCLNGRQPNCLPTWPKVNFQLPLFQNLQILRTIASRHDVIHTPASLPIWGLLWQLWLSYPLCTSVNCTQCYAPELRAK